MNGCLSSLRPPAPLVAHSSCMQRFVQRLERAARGRTHVLVSGERGSGKSLVTQHLHALSERATQSCVTLNVPALLPDEVDAELFGRLASADGPARPGVFERAHGGTLVLDEVAELPHMVQARLAHCLHTGEVRAAGAAESRLVDVRVVCTTHRDLAALAAEGGFREELLARLNTVELSVPPLRARREDIEPLAERLLGEVTRHQDRSAPQLGDAARRALLAHGWPGNVRELAHALERATLLGTGAQLTASDLALAAGDTAPARLDGLTLREAEKVLILRAIERAQRNVRQAAVELGVSRSALYRKLQRHGITPPNASTQRER